jgi:Ca-activated chloride channel family protein
MDSHDVSPTRLEKVKFEINHFLDAMGSNRIGLIVFSNEAYTQSPLTYDRAALNLYVQSLRTDLLPGSGTNLCSSLELAYLKISQDEAASDKSKILVLFTDAERKADCNPSLFNNIRRFGIRLFVVGVGTPEGSFIRVNDTVLKDEDGESVVSKLRDDVIQNLAQQTQGSGYRIDNKTNDLNSLIQDINVIEGQVIDRRRVAVVSNKYYYFLIIALGLLVLDVLITVRTFRL